MHSRILLHLIVPALALILAGCGRKASLVDDAGGRTVADFPEIAADVFAEMDGGIELSSDEIKGRNTWNLWCAGDEQFWDRMTRESYGLIDLIKVIDSRKRPNRFKEMGLINQPGYRQANEPYEYGLWIDQPIEGEGEDTSVIDPDVYGRSTGIMGYRLFENPDFDEEAEAKWDPDKYYNDGDYARRDDIIRPYRVGISCGSCHIALNPTNPPDDPENPEWENLASAIGNQYIREGAAFANIDPGGLFWEMTQTQPPGTSDTSRIATDNINNPNAINPIFELDARLEVAHEEELAGDTLNLPGVSAKMAVPHVLKDGADSSGVPGATLRVYINIGSYPQHWLQQHNALVGLVKQKPFSIETAQENSVYWRATQTKFENVAKFFMRLESFRLEDAPGGGEYITGDPEIMRRGQIVFAENCATCHSSKRPPDGLSDDEAVAWFREAVAQPDFRENNFFSDERRYSVARIQTNAGRAAATNAMRGHIWSSFSSETYKNLPQVGPIDVWNPYTEQTEKFQLPAGGPGYYRTASLISLWSSAPFLHNNALGKYTGDPSVAGRMEAFNDAVEKLLWPERRLDKDSIWRTTQACSLQLHRTVIPEPLRTLLRSHIDDDGYFRIGHIPEGTPVNLLANINPEADPKEIVRVVLKIKRVLAEIAVRDLDAAEAKALMRDELAADLLKISKCPDLITDRGHYFGAELPDGDKRALIEYLKTL